MNYLPIHFDPYTPTSGKSFTISKRSFSLLLFAALMTCSTHSYGQFVIRVFSLQPDGNYQEMNESVSVSVQSLTGAKVAKTQLERTEKGHFIYKVGEPQWLLAEIRDLKGTIHQRKVFAKDQTENDLNIAVGESEWYSFDFGRVMPFIPVNNQFYMELKTKQPYTKEEYQKRMAEIRAIGIYELNDYLPVYNIDESKTTQKAAFAALLKRTDINQVAPLTQPVEQDNLCRYFSSEAEVLIDSSLTDSAMDKVFRRCGITNFQKIPLPDHFKNYGPGTAYFIQFPMEQMICYEFLKTLKKLYEQPEVLLIQTESIGYATQD